MTVLLFIIFHLLFSFFHFIFQLTFSHPHQLFEELKTRCCEWLGADVGDHELTGHMLDGPFASKDRLPCKGTPQPQMACSPIPTIT